MKNQKGSVIILTAFIILFGAMLFYALELLHRSDLEIVTNQIRDLQALYCAEAGIERSINNIRTFTNWPNGLAVVNGIYTWPLPEGTTTPQCNANTNLFASSATFQTNISETYIDPNYTDYRNLVIITSTGTANGFTRRIYTHIRRARITSSGLGGLYYYSQVLRWDDL